MIEKGKYGIVDVIGISLVVVAIISAGGLYYTASTYTAISETITYTDAFMIDVNATRSNVTGNYDFLTTIMVINNSTLEIEVYDIEFNVFAYSNEIYGIDYSHHIASSTGGVQVANRTVMERSSKNMYQRFEVKTGASNMETLQENIQGGFVFIGINGFAIYEISDFPEVTERMYFSYWNWVKIYEP